MSATSKRYCLGFVFNYTGEKVLLMKKGKPEWQVNKFNGLGGKIEFSENPADAMEREFAEETSFNIEANHWQHFCTLTGNGFELVCFCHYTGTSLEKIEQGETEPIGVFEVGNLPRNSIPNIHWLIPMALSLGRGEPANHFTIEEKYER